MAQKNQKSGYPVQNPTGYPVQPQGGGHAPYPGQNPAPGFPTQQYHQPSYNQQYPQQYPHMNQQPGTTPAYSPHAQTNYGGPPPPYPGMAPNPAVQQPLVYGSFDSGARFKPGASRNIPPPPPGVMPTASQVASASGQPVLMDHPKTGWLEGARGGGYTFW